MKSLLKNRAQHQSSAVDSFMKPVLEASQEDFSDEEEARQSSTGDTPPEESSESFQLAKRETAMIKYSKILVVVVIFVLAIVVSSLTYVFVRHIEHNDYKSSVSTAHRQVDRVRIS